MRTLHVAAFLIAAATAISTGCKTNAAATSACSSSTDSTTCESCCKANGANGYKYVGSCSCLGGSGKTAAASPATTTTFAGSYNSTWGKSEFTQSGNTVNVTYARGTMKCTATGNALDCDWDEGAGGKGRAKLVKETSGTIRGTWGAGASDSNGGAWVFTP